MSSSGIATVNRDESRKLVRTFVKHGFATLDLTDDELAKQHVRHMVGGRSPLARDERLYRFLFPGAAGRLMRFLSSMPAGWNISLFHYRNQGADYGRILVGIQVPAADKASFRKFLRGPRLSLPGRNGQSGVSPLPSLKARSMPFSVPSSPRSRTCRWSRRFFASCSVAAKRPAAWANSNRSQFNSA
jgi:hypothetical protein